MAPTQSDPIADFLRLRRGAWNAFADIKRANDGIPDRTLRRRLVKLVEQGLVERTGERKIARYRWGGGAVPTYMPPLDAAEKHIFTPESMQLLNRVAAPLYTRPPVTYNEEWIKSYVPNQSFYLTPAQRNLLKQQGKRPMIQGRAGTYIQKIFNRLLVDLSYNSSRLEGNTYTLADTEQLLLKGVSPAGKLDDERVMILNHKEAIRYLARNTLDLLPNEETIRTLHYLLADGLVAPGLAGQIREESVLISGTTYAPLEGHGRLARLLAALLDIAGRIEDPFEQSFFLLGHIAYLQAFVDVNKRLARLASVIPLIKNDYVPHSFVDADKDAYLAALICFYEFNEVMPLAELYCWSYQRTCLHFDVSVQAMAIDEISIIYRPRRRQLLGAIIRSMIPIAEIPTYLTSHMPVDISPEHHEKFAKDVMADIVHLDVPMIAGLGIDKQELRAWLAENRYG